jgi:hypothetical protein
LYLESDQKEPVYLPDPELLGLSLHSTTLRAMFSFTDFAMESKFRYPAISEEIGSGKQKKLKYRTDNTFVENVDI